MRVPLSWLKEYVEIPIGPEELAERLTLAGMEVVAIEYIGVPQHAPPGITVPPSDHLVWARDKIVLGAIHEVKAHPNADRLVLAMVDHGTGALEQVVTGAPNLYPFRDKGPIQPPLLVPYAREGAEVYDGHAEGRQRMILKEKALRGIPNKSMVCSARELGLGDDHEGILLLSNDELQSAPGTPLVDILGDVIFDLDLTPNMARAYGVLGVAREVAALLGTTLREPPYSAQMTGAPVQQAVQIEIRNPTLNPRFCAMMIRDIEIKPSPQWMQRRLAAVGVRAISNIVDVTNYVMFETGQPLHAFDYDILLQRSAGATPTILTRTAQPGEKLTTLDGVERTLDDQAVLVCDAQGALGLGGIMGGAESEIRAETRHVLLEAANWNFINIRRTMTLQKLASEAGTRFSRGVHPELAMRAVQRAAEFMRALGGPSARLDQGVLDVYPLPAPVICVDLALSEVERIIGVALSADQVIDILQRLQFGVTLLPEADARGAVLRVTVPDHRVDISGGEVGIADLCEEIARVYGYDRIPNDLIDDVLPPQSNNDSLSQEERVRDLLAQAGLREAINYRLTTPEAEARLQAPGMPPALPQAGYVTLANPISLDRTVLRHTLLNGLLENLTANMRHTTHQKLFEIGSVFRQHEGVLLPEEPRHLALALTGPREVPAWQDGPEARKRRDMMDYFDLKGTLEALVAGLRVRPEALIFRPEEHGSFHPGRCAALYAGAQRIGYAGELHPLVREAYGLPQPIMAAELALDPLLAEIATVRQVNAIPTQPAVYQDVALIVSDATPADAVEAAIREAGGPLLRVVTLFDVYRGEPIPAGKKSLAYALTYQADDRTLTDAEVARVHQQIVKAVERKLGAILRG